MAFEALEKALGDIMQYKVDIVMEIINSFRLLKYCKIECISKREKETKEFVDRLFSLFNEYVMSFFLGDEKAYLNFDSTLKDDDNIIIQLDWLTI
ncbi:hypothetical protein CR513_06603, partial [Mucuna pruriens]